MPFLNILMSLPNVPFIKMFSVFCSGKEGEIAFFSKKKNVGTFVV